MAPSSSSTKRAARLAQKGKGQKVRFQGGTLFPMVVAIILVLGLALVFYARQSRPSVDASPPTIDDHWHVAYGFYLCDQWVKLTGDLEEQGPSGFINQDFARTGIHSHDDGIIHWHPFSPAATGGNATLGLFLNNYGVELTDDTLQFPESQRAQLPYQQDTGTFENGTTQCDVDGTMKDGELKVVTWDNYQDDVSDNTTYIADLDKVRISKNSMVIVIAFVPKGTDVTMPEWAANLPDLGATDTGQVTPGDLLGTTTVPGETAPTDTGATDTAPTDSAPADTGVPATSGG